MYFPFVEDKPAGANTPPVYSQDDLVNIRALRDAVVSGFFPGWAFALSTAVGPPVTNTYLWSKGIYRFRATVTFTAGLITSLLWEWSENSGGLYTIVNTGGSAAAITCAADGTILTQDKDAVVGFLLGLSAAQRASGGSSGLAAHTAATGTAVHGLGTIATQNANLVALTGGDISAVKARLLERLSPATPTALVGGAGWDWNATPTMVTAAPGITVGAITNHVPGEMKRIEVLGAGAITLTGVTWCTGHPIWGTTGTIVNIVAKAGGGFIATTIGF